MDGSNIANVITNATGEPMYPSTGNTAVVAYPASNTTGYQPVSGDSRIYILSNRGDINAGSKITPDGNICYGNSNTFTYDPNGATLSAGEVLMWTLYNSSYGVVNSATEVYNGTSQTGYVFPSTLDVGTYYLKLEIKSTCCGLSKPLWQTLTVNRLEATIEFGD